MLTEQYISQRVHTGINYFTPDSIAAISTRTQLSKNRSNPNMN